MYAAQWDPVSVRPSGLVVPSRVDRTGRLGPTWRQANGPYWRKVAPNRYVPEGLERRVEQRILEQASRLHADGSSGCVTAWAALRWWGAAFFDGLGDGGVTELPVPLAIGAGSTLATAPGSVLSRFHLSPNERRIVAGVPVTSVQRALFDEIRRRASLWPAVAAIDMAAAADLISAWLFATYIGDRNALNGVPLAREACALAVDESRSPRETWMRLVWLLVARLPTPLVNRAVYDREGRMIGIPDLFDPVAGLVGEYDGAHHREEDRRAKDLAREERFRDHGLEYATIVTGDSRNVAARRLRAARTRAKFLPPESCAWTLERPAGDPEPESLDDRLARLGRVQELTSY
jgi:hypothetical protein